MINNNMINNKLTNKRNNKQKKTRTFLTSKGVRLFHRLIFYLSHKKTF